MREAAQIHHSALGLKVATRYDDVDAILRDNRFGRGEQRLDPALFGLTQEEFDDRYPDAGGINESMLEVDPPDHTRLRRLVAKAFTPNTVEQLKPEIQRLTDMFLDPLEGDVDLMPALALKLPITVIGQMLGVPEADYADLMPHIKIVIRALRRSRRTSTSSPRSTRRATSSATTSASSPRRSASTPTTACSPTSSTPRRRATSSASAS